MFLKTIWWKEEERKREKQRQEKSRTIVHQAHQLTSEKDMDGHGIKRIIYILNAVEERHKKTEWNERAQQKKRAYTHNMQKQTDQQNVDTDRIRLYDTIATAKEKPLTNAPTTT